MGTCPECDENFEISEDMEVGDIVECPKCEVRLELLNLMPGMVDYAER